MSQPEGFVGLADSGISRWTWTCPIAGEADATTTSQDWKHFRKAHPTADASQRP
jgi:hypothetical protein